MNISQIEEAVQALDNQRNANTSETDSAQHTEESRRPPFLYSDAIELIQREYLPQVLQGVATAPAYDNKLNSAATTTMPLAKDYRDAAAEMPLFHQKNELSVAYLELKDNEIAALGKAIFDNPLAASTINHINFSGNQFPDERFVLFLHCVVAPILYFSGALAVEGRVDIKKTYESGAPFKLPTTAKPPNDDVQDGGNDDSNNNNNNEKDAEETDGAAAAENAKKRQNARANEILLSYVKKAIAFKQLLRLSGDTRNAAASAATLSGWGYASPPAVRNASSGCGTDFGVTNLECDNNGGSTEGWKALVGILSGDEGTVLEEGEAVRQRVLGSEFYTLKAASARLTSIIDSSSSTDAAASSSAASDEKTPDGATNETVSILNCVSHHLTTLSQIEMAENYIHDLGARYAAVLLPMCSNIRSVSLTTNQLTQRAAGDIADIFATRFELLGEKMMSERAAIAEKLAILDNDTKSDDKHADGGAADAEGAVLDGPIFISEKEVAEMISKAVGSAVAEKKDDDDDGSDAEEEAARLALEKKYVLQVLTSIVKSSKIVAAPKQKQLHDKKQSSQLTAVTKDAVLLPFSCAPADFLSFPFYVTPRLAEPSFAYCLQQLFLDYNSLGDSGVERAAAVIGNSIPSLQRLGLSDNRVGPAGAKAVARHIVANPRCRVQHLNLSVNAMGDEGLIAIAKALSCAFVVKNESQHSAASASTSSSSSASSLSPQQHTYTLYFKRGVRFDRPPSYLYDTDTDLYINDDDTFGGDAAAAAAAGGIPVRLVPEEADGEDGLGEGHHYADTHLSAFSSAAGVALTQQQVDLLLCPSVAEGRAASINTRLYHIDLANQSATVTAAGREAIVSLAFSYKYLMNLDIIALDVSNSEMRKLARGLTYGGTAAVTTGIAATTATTGNSDSSSPSPSSSSAAAAAASSFCPYWQYTCGLINSEWYNNPRIFPQTEQLMGYALEAAIVRCQIRERFVDTYLKKESYEASPTKTILRKTKEEEGGDDEDKEKKEDEGEEAVAEEDEFAPVLVLENSSVLVQMRRLFESRRLAALEKINAEAKKKAKNNNASNNAKNQKASAVGFLPVVISCGIAVAAVVAIALSKSKKQKL